MFQNPKSPKNIRNITNRVTNPDKADQIGTACHVTNSAVEGGCYASRIKKGGEVLKPPSTSLHCRLAYTSKGQVYRMRQSIESTCIDGKGEDYGSGGGNGYGYGFGYGDCNDNGFANGNGHGDGHGHGNGKGTG